MATQTPSGIKVLHTNEYAVWDICFVHGLGGHRERTWTGSYYGRARDKPWPKEFLPLALPPYLPARIMTYGYVINISNPAPDELDNHARDLMKQLTKEREKCPERPLVFVAHGLGGIICQKTFIMAIMDSKYEGELSDHILGIIFIGCPVRGPGVVKYLDVPVMSVNAGEPALRVRDAINMDDTDMIKLQNSMWMMSFKANLFVHCFFELHETLQLGGFVVEQETATREPEHGSSGIDADHNDMVKFDRREDPGFRQFVDVLVSWKLSSLPTKTISTFQWTLHPQDFWASQNNFTEFLPATCEWLLKNARYKTWQSQGGLFQIQGKPGSGKSNLAWFASEEAVASGGLNQELVLSHFFDGRISDDVQLAPLMFWCDLFSQLLDFGTLEAKADAVTSELGIRTLKLRKIVPNGELWENEVSGWMRIVDQCLRKVLEQRRVRIFIGGIDEVDSNAAESIVKYMAKLSREHNEKNPLFTFHCMFTCRTYFNLPGQSVVSAKAFNRNDVEIFVQSELRAMSYPVLPELVMELTNGAGGVFVWVKLVLLQLRSAGALNLTGLVAKIREMPSELEALYRKIIINLAKNKKNASKSLHLFLWVVFARRRIDLNELGWAQLAERGDQEALKSYVHNNKTDYCTSDDVKKLGGGLVECRHTLGLLHHSVKDFLLKEGFAILSAKTPLHPTTQKVSLAGQAHYQLARTCLQFLAAQDLESHFANGPDSDLQDQLERRGFWEYTNAWSSHAGISDQHHGVVQDYISEQWDQLCNSGVLVGHGDNILHLLGRYQLCNTLQNAVMKFKKDNSGSVPVSILEQKNVNGETPLYSACSHEGITTPLFEITLPHAEKCAEVLLNCGAQINVTDRRGESPLHEAALEGRTSIAKLLIGLHAGIGKVNLQLETPLHIATTRGFTSIVKMLLEHGAKVNERDVLNRTPLYIAAKEGYDPIVTALLAHNADTNAVGGELNRTSLQRAAKRGHDSAVKLLLDHGARVDLTDMAEATALHRAALQGHDSVARLLIKYHAPLNTFDMNHWTPLHCAAANGHAGTVQALLGFNAPIDAQARTPDGPGPTALHVAASRGHCLVVKILTFHYIDVNAVNQEGATALHEAAAAGHDSVVEILLDRGAKPDVVNSEGATPLDMAKTFDHELVAKKLLDHIAKWE